MLNASHAAVLAAFISVSSLGATAEAKTADASTCGHASWYALTSKTASGERMNPSLLTAAHKSYKFGTMLRVQNRKNGKSVIVRINDRGPFIKGRMLDLSRAAAQQIGIKDTGGGQVCTQVVAKS